MNGLWPFCKKDEFTEELKQAGWDILHENPGTERGDWIYTLIEQYPTEVVDALGTNTMEVEALLCDWWDCMEYEDEETGFNERFRDWAEYFANECSVELYDLLVEARRKIRLLEERQGKRQ